jgi:hypothetical protein
MASMILALIFLIVPLFFGFSTVLKSNFLDTYAEKLAVGLPIGIALFSFENLLLYAVFGSFSTYIPIISSASLLVAGAVLTYRNRSGMSKKFYNMPKLLFVSFLLLFAVLAVIFSTSMYYYGGNLYCSNIGMCSDISYHVGIGESLLHTGFPPKYPFAIDTINIFPFIADFYTAILIEYGMGLIPSIIASDLILIFCISLLGFEMAYKITKSSVAVLSSQLFFWFGTNYALVVLIDYLKLPGWFNQVVAQPIQKAGSIAGIAAQLLRYPLSSWVYSLYYLIMPQRDLILGLAITLPVFYLFYMVSAEHKRMGHTEIAIIGICVGMLPLINPTSFLVAIIFLVIGLAYYRDRFRPKEVFYVGILILAIALPQLAYMHTQSISRGWFSLLNGLNMPGGNAEDYISAPNFYSVLLYWIENIGIVALIAVPGIAYIGKKRIGFFAPFLAIFVLINIISIQPNPLDSNKIFVYIYFFLAVLGGYGCAWLFSRKIAYKIFMFAIILLVVVPGLTVYIFNYSSPYQLLSSSDISAINFIENSTPNGAVFAVNNYTTLFQMLAFTGRGSVISIEPYVSIDEYTVPPRAMENISNSIVYNGSCANALKYNVSYVLFEGIPKSVPHNLSLVYSNVSDSEMYQMPLMDDIYIYRLECHKV